MSTRFVEFVNYVIILCDTLIFTDMHVFDCVTSPAQCQDEDVRLAGSDLAGRVEVCISQRWGSVCAYGWNNEDASVVCKQLGYSTGKL